MAAKTRRLVVYVDEKMGAWLEQTAIARGESLGCITRALLSLARFVREELDALAKMRKRPLFGRDTRHLNAYACRLNPLSVPAQIVPAESM